jgi:type I restriction enzyme S subunit
MSEWKEYKIKDIAEILDFKRKPLSSMERAKRKGQYPYYGASGIIDYLDDYIFEGEHVLISEDGENLRSRQTPIAFLADGQFWVNNHAHIIKSDYVHNRLICYYFANLDMNPFITGAVQPKLSQDSLCRIPIYLPKSIGERKKMVSILSSLNDKIDLLNRENATLEAMAETLFRQWFIEDAKEDWEEGTIDMYANHYKESINPQKQPTTMFWHYSIPAFDNGKKPIDEMGEEIQSSKYIIPSNCILFSKLNPHKDKRVWLILDNVSTNAICSTEFQIVKPKEKKYLYFLYGWLTNKENYEEIASGVGGTSGSHQRIDPKSIFTFACPYVNIDVIHEYNKVVEPLFLKQRENQKQIIILTEQRDRLLPKLMSNEINIK